MIFGLKEKWIILTHIFLNISTNIPVLLMTAFVLQGHVCVCVFKASPTTVSLCVIAIYLFKYAGIWSWTDTQRSQFLENDLYILSYLIISEIIIILHHPYSCYVCTLYNLFAHCCLYYYYLLSLQYTVLHILFIYFYLYLRIFSCVVLHIIALSIERTWLTFHCWLYSV